jgi:hypothetical protein
MSDTVALATAAQTAVAAMQVALHAPCLCPQERTVLVSLLEQVIDPLAQVLGRLSPTEDDMEALAAAMRGVEAKVDADLATEALLLSAFAEEVPA